MRTSSLKILIVMGGLIASIRGTPVLGAGKVPPEWNPATLAVDIKLGTPQEQQAALDKMKQWIDIDPVEGSLHLRRAWVKPLMDAGRYAEVEDWCLVGILASLQDASQLEDLLQLRIQALLSLNKPQEALQAAKSYFNIARSKQTSQALLLIAKCLEKAYPQDKEIYERFRNEQVAGAVTDGKAPRSKTMDSIKIDAAIYQEDLAKYGKRERGDTATLLAYGNLLLLADQPTQAAEVFGQLGRKNKRQYVENMARAYKAQDGVIGPANGYLLTGEE